MKRRELTETFCFAWFIQNYFSALLRVILLKRFYKDHAVNVCHLSVINDEVHLW